MPINPGTSADIPRAAPVSVLLNGSVNIDSMSIGNGVTLDVFYGTTLTVTDGISNNGTIVMNYNTGPWPCLTFNGSQTLCGTGRCDLSLAQLINTSNGGVLTQVAGHTIGGWGDINAALINQSLVNANSNGNTLYLQSNAMTNAGTMEATNGGVLSVNTTVNNTDSTILAAGGNVQINGGTIVGGTLSSSGSSGLLAMGAAGLSGVTISSGSQYKIHYNTTTTVTGGLTNNGTIVVNFDTSTWPYLTFNGSQTLCGTGTVAMTGGIINTSNSSDVLTVAAGQTISGFGTINAALINQGLVNATNSTGISLTTNAMTNTGTMEATNGGVLSVNTTVNNTDSTILAAGGNVQINGGTVVGGTLSSSGSSGLLAMGAAPV